MFVETEARAFVAEHPTYLSTDDNYRALVAYLSQQYLHKELTDDNLEPTLDALTKIGKFNRDTLGEAFEELSAAGLLELKEPEKLKPVKPAAKVAARKPATPVAASKPASSTSGIRTTVRPRATAANFGLRQKATTASVQPTNSNPVPSDEELEAMSNEEINKLMEGVLMERARQYRR